MLALGIGANTAIFSLLEAVVLKPLPYRDPDRLVVVHNSKNGEAFGPHSSSAHDYEDWRAEKASFAQMALFSYWTFTLTGRDVPARIVGGRVTGDFFATLGVEPLLGRTLAPDDDLAGSPEAVILSYRAWQGLFGGSEAVLGEDIVLNGRAHTVVGVMPEEFRFPAENVEIWAAMQDHTRGLQRHNRFMLAVARLAPGVAVSQAQRALDVVTARLETEYPETNRGYSARLVSAHETQVGKAEPALVLLLVAVGFVLLIACINVSNLMLTRAVARRRDAATRMALGARWTRLARGYLAESLSISLAGGVLGVLLAMLGLRVLLRLHPGGVPRLDQVGIDTGVLVFTLAVSAATGLALGLVPALDAWRGGLSSSLKAGGRAELEGSRGSRLRGLLVTLEVALSLVLLVGGGLLMRSFLKLTAVDPGFRAERTLTMSVFLTPPRYQTIPERWEYAERALVSIAALPGVQAAAAITDPPLSQGFLTMSVFEEGRPMALAEAYKAAFRAVSDGYFTTLRIPLREGRGIEPGDDERAEKVVVVNESFARLLGEGSVVGRRIRWADRERDPNPLTIVGVVNDIRSRGLDQNEGPAIYAPMKQITFGWLRWFTFALRAAGEAEALAGASRDALLRIDPDQPVFEIRTLESALASSVAERRFHLFLVQAFAAVALVLAALGVYGVMSHSVSERTREIGLRVSLGAQRRDILGLFVRRGMRFSVAGILAGLAAAAGLTRFMASMLFGVEPLDPWTFGTVALLLVSVALAASFVPARRAADFDPAKAMRYE
jgi:putative ABC transport system permease protein